MRSATKPAADFSRSIAGRFLTAAMSHTTLSTANHSGKVHFLRLDMLRGVAILLVFLFHYLLAVEQRDVTLASDARLSDTWAPLLLLHRVGFLGVQLFFVISGFCIHYSYLSWKRKSRGEADRQFFPHFYSRRFWRIVPPYLIALAVFYLLKTPHPFNAFHLKHLAPHVILANTLFPSETFSVNPSFWSVAVEWQLYLVYPLVLFLFSRLGATRGFLITASIGVIFRFMLEPWGAPYWLSHSPFRWWYEWSLGVLLAASWSEKRRIFFPNALFGFFVAGVTVFAVMGSHDRVFQWIMPPFFFAFLVEISVWSAKPVSWFERGVGLLGLCSYSFYLWHQPLLNAAVSLAAHEAGYLNAFEIWIPLCALILAALTLLSAAFYQLTEKPSIALGQWLARRKSRHAESAPAFQAEDGTVDLLPSAAKPE
jgi:peptidoglycan/LPS O-acetylase OafA/YrhL